MTDTEETTFNADMARKVLAWIAEHPTEHDQSSWARRSRTYTDAEWNVTMCAGAVACAIAGAELIWSDGEYTSYSGYVTTASLPEHARGKNNDETYMGYAAQRLLGLDEYTACRLFLCTDTLHDIRAILDPMITASDNN